MSKKPTVLKKIIKDLFPPKSVNDKPPAIKMDADVSAKIAAAMKDLLDRLGPLDNEDNDEKLSPGFNACGKPIDDRSEASNTLPVPINKFPAHPGRDNIKWTTLGHLPGMMDPRIRKLSEMVFGSFPCYNEFAKQAKADGLNANRMVYTISDFTNGKTETGFIAQAIKDHGVLVDAGEGAFDEYIPGYAPKIAIFTTKEWTFKLVMDREELGAPVNANYIYAWPGGTDFYDAHPDALPQMKPLPVLEAAPK